MSAHLIRRAVPSDGAAVAEAFQDGIERLGGVLHEPAFYAEHFERAIGQAASPFGVWVLEVGGRVWAWASVLPVVNNPNLRPRVGEVSTYVHRGCPLKDTPGRLVTAYAEAEAENAGLQQLLGFVSTSNRPAQRLYEVLGWTNVGTVPASTGEPPVGERSLYVRTLTPPHAPA